MSASGPWCIARSDRRRFRIERANINITTWILAGGIVGWIGFSHFGCNAKRGVLISLVIGVAGGWIGGGLFAPLLDGVPVNSGDFNPLSLFVALATAVGCLAVSDMIYRRFGI